MMKNVLFSMLLVVSAGACSDSSTDENLVADESTEAARLLHAKVGAPISASSGQQWAQAYEDRYPGQRHSFFVGRETLLKLLAIEYNGNPLDGLHFVKGLKDDGEETMMAVPAQSGNMVLYLSAPHTSARKGDSGTIYDFASPDIKSGMLGAIERFHARVGAPVDIKSARRWVASYTSFHTSDEVPKSYFVGAQALTTLLATMNQGRPIDGLRFIKGVNERQEEALIIVPVQGGLDLWKVSATSPLTRTQEDTDGSYDFNMPCPNTCAANKSELIP